MRERKRIYSKSWKSKRWISDIRNIFVSKHSPGDLEDKSSLITNWRGARNKVETEYTLNGPIGIHPSRYSSFRIFEIYLNLSRGNSILAWRKHDGSGRLSGEGNKSAQLAETYYQLLNWFNNRVALTIVNKNLPPT